MIKILKESTQDDLQERYHQLYLKVKEINENIFNNFNEELSLQIKYFARDCIFDLLGPIYVEKNRNNDPIVTDVGMLDAEDVNEMINLFNKDYSEEDIKFILKDLYRDYIDNLIDRMFN